MSDNVPSDKSEAPGSDQSQSHLSDRQATAGDHTERQAPDGEDSGPPLSDRQATADSWDSNFEADLWGSNSYGSNAEVGPSLFSRKSPIIGPLELKKEKLMRKLSGQDE